MVLVTLTSSDETIQKQFLTQIDAEAWWLNLHITFINYLLSGLAVRGQPIPRQLFDLINNVGPQYFNNIIEINSNVGVDIVRQVLSLIGASELFTGL